METILKQHGGLLWQRECWVALPLDEEPIAQWGGGCGLAQFLRGIYDVSTEVITERGSRLVPEYSSGLSMYSSEVILATQAVSDFASVTHWETEELVANTAFGGAMQAVCAWRGMQRRLQEPDVQELLPQIREGTCELESSTLLAARSYYRQANQQVRSFLEGQVLAAYFMLEPSQFEAWLGDEMDRMPSVRGRNGMLRRLVDASRITERMAHEIGECYGALSAYVHGTAAVLNYSPSPLYASAGVPSALNRATFVPLRMPFRSKDLPEWAGWVRTAVFSAIALVREALCGRADELRSRCLRCQGRKVPEESFAFAGETYLNRRCLGCGATDLADADGRSCWKVDW